MWMLGGIRVHKKDTPNLHARAQDRILDVCFESKEGVEYKVTRPTTRRSRMAFQEKEEALYITQVRENIVDSKSSLFIYDHIKAWKKGGVMRVEMNEYVGAILWNNLCVVIGNLSWTPWGSTQRC